MNTTELEIGKAILTYDENGTPTGASFEPTMKVRIDPQTLAARLASAPADIDIEHLQVNARKVFAEWFNQMNAIELADPGEYEVANEIVECVKWDNGRPQFCVIRFTFRPVGGTKHIS